MKKIFFLIFFISINVFATPQIPDILLYKGRKYDWNGHSPAFKYLEDKQIKVPSEAIRTTARNDFYTMTYSIENDSLYLVDVEILISKNSNLETKSVFKEFFPNQTKILMSSYSTVRALPYGKEVSVTENNWTDVHYKYYLVFEFKNGILKTLYDLNYKRFLKLKRELFMKFKTTSDYNKAIIDEVKNLESFNEFRPNKYTMDEYLELVILKFTKTLKS